MVDPSDSVNSILSGSFCSRCIHPGGLAPSDKPKTDGPITSAGGQDGTGCGARPIQRQSFVYLKELLGFIVFREHSQNTSLTSHNQTF